MHTRSSSINEVNIVITSSLLSMNLIIDAVLRWHTTCNTYGNFNSAIMMMKSKSQQTGKPETKPVFFIQKTDDLLTHFRCMTSRPIECASPHRLVDFRIHHGDGSDPPITVVGVYYKLKNTIAINAISLFTSYINIRKLPDCWILKWYQYDELIYHSLFSIYNCHGFCGFVNVSLSYDNYRYTAYTVS